MREENVELKEKPDGRQYSRVLRRIVAIVRTLPKQGTHSLTEMAALIREKELPEFHLKRFERQISEARVRDYLRYLKDLGALAEVGEGFQLNFTHPKTGPEYAQVFSDLALEHLGKIMHKQPANVTAEVLSASDKLLRSRQIPTVDQVAAFFHITSAREMELFRWSVFVYTDGEASRFDIHRYPILANKSDVLT
jgi:hypothetical protein